MKNNFLLLCAAAAVSALTAGCTKPGDETPPPSPEIIVDTTVPVAADATSCTIEYELKNAGDKDVVDAEPSETWITVAEVTPDAVQLTLTANTDEQPREGTVTLRLRKHLKSLKSR